MTVSAQPNTIYMVIIVDFEAYELRVPVSFNL